jgi:hypothetical protein
MRKNPPVKKELVKAKLTEDSPPVHADFQMVDRFWMYKIDASTIEVWHNPKPRKVKSLPTKHVGNAYYRPKLKQWGAFVWLNPKKPPTFIGMHDTDELIGMHLYNNETKLRK